MFRKNFIFLILPFCLQCHRNDYDKNKQSIESSNDNPDGVLRTDERSHVTVNDESNVFSDDIKKLRQNKEILKLQDPQLFASCKEFFLGSNDQENIKTILEHKDSRLYLEESIKSKFVRLILITAKKYFIRHIDYDDKQQQQLNDIILNKNFKLSEDFIKNVCDIFEDKFSQDGKDQFTKELTSLGIQYKQAREIIKSEKFDS